MRAKIATAKVARVGIKQVIFSSGNLRAIDQVKSIDLIDLD